MKRKLVQHGQTSIVTSLPIDWIRENNLKPGDQVEIQKADHNLIISPEEEKVVKTYTINTNKIDRSTLYLLLINLYRKGYDEVTILHKNKQIIDYETNKEVNTLSKVKSWLPRFLGWEVMKQDDEKTLIKDVTRPKEDNIQPLIKRIFFLFNSFIDTEIEAIEKNTLKNVNVDDFYQTCIKLVNLSIRTINKNALNKETVLLLNYLHRIAQQIKNSHKEPKNSKIIEEFNQIKTLFDLYNAKFEKIPELMKKRFEIKTKSQLQNLITETTHIIFYLKLDEMSQVF